VSILLIGTGAVAGIVKNSGLNADMISVLNACHLPAFALAPLSSVLLSGATASTTAGVTIASQTFSGALAEAIRTKYGDVEALKEQMTKSALALFGSGWVWLVCDDKGELSIVNTQNAGNPLTEGLHPLLTIDVWEHAYYIDHRNLRAEGVKAFWEVLDWKVIEERYDKCCKR
jgi:superoxide dismutase